MMLFCVQLLLTLWKLSCAPDMCPHLMVEMIVKCDELMQKAKKILLLVSCYLSIRFGLRKTIQDINIAPCDHIKIS